MEQLNIEGKRSGDGFVCHRERLVSALAKAQAPKADVIGLTLGRKGLLNYLRLLGGSNVVKIIPSTGSGQSPSDGGASESQAADKRLKVICGSNTGYLEDEAWVAEGMRYSDTCQVRVSPHNSVTPNLGGIELAEALSKVLPFAAPKKDERMALKCVRFAQREGKLTLTACDGFRLAEQSLDFEDGEGDVLILAQTVKGMVSALRKARRVKLGIEQGEGSLDRKTLVIHTEAASYRFDGYDGTYPDTSKVIPAEFVAEATVDTREMLKAGASLGALFLDRDVPVIISIGDGNVRLYVKDEKGEAHVEAEGEGKAEIAINSLYLTQALRSFGGMARLQVNTPQSPLLMSADGYRVLLMPVFVGVGKKDGEGQAEDVPPPEGEAQEVAPPQPEPEAEEQAQDKPKRTRKQKQPVA